MGLKAKWLLSKKAFNIYFWSAIFFLIIIERKTGSYLHVQLPEIVCGTDISRSRTVVMNIYLIYRAGGPYGKKLCPRSWVRPEAEGRGPYSRPRAQSFSHTDRPSPVNNIFFSGRLLFKAGKEIGIYLRNFKNILRPTPEAEFKKYSFLC